MKSFDMFLKESAEPALTDVYLDLDGVLVDFYTGSAKALKNLGLTPFSPQDANNKGDDERWQALDGVKRFWQELPPLHDGLTLLKYIEHFIKPNILSAAPKANFEDAEKGKLEWIKNHLGLSRLRDIHIVKRKQKQDFAINKTTNRPNILIDDYQLNCDEWKAAGGIAILYKSTESTINSLKELGFSV